MFLHLMFKTFNLGGYWIFFYGSVQVFSSSSSTVWWRRTSGSSSEFICALDVSDWMSTLVQNDHMKTLYTIQPLRSVPLSWCAHLLAEKVIPSYSGFCWQNGATLRRWESRPNPERISQERHRSPSSRWSPAPQKAHPLPRTPAREIRPARDHTWVRNSNSQNVKVKSQICVLEM